MANSEGQMDKIILAEKDGVQVDVTNEPISQAWQYTNYTYKFINNQMQNILETLSEDDKKLYNQLLASGKYKELFELGYAIGGETTAKKFTEQYFAD